MSIQVKNKRFSWIAISISVIGVLVYAFVERQIYLDYQSLEGEKRAFYGLHELFGFAQKIYIVFIGLLCLFVTWMAKYKKEERKYVVIAFILSLVCMIFPFIPIWKIFV